MKVVFAFCAEEFLTAPSGAVYLFLKGGELVSVWRIVDANLNRASEGLRVVEEIARFILDHEQLTARVKQCRHQLAGVCRHPAFRYDELIATREAESDVGGAGAYSESEGRRSSYGEIAVANMKRVQEAARALEEFGKLLSPEIGFAFKRFRFQTYTLEKELAAALGHMEHPSPNWDLYVITGEALSKGRSAAEVAEQAVAGGAGVIQLREKKHSARELVVMGREIQQITRRAGVLFIVNDRVDVALTLDADGVHVGQDDMQLADVRKLLGPQKIIGVSVHSVAEARLAEQGGADYLGIGPIYYTGTKEDARTPAGTQLIRDIKQAVSLPCVAIGGINHSNAAEVARAGADGAAVISAVVGADDIRAAASSLKQIICSTKTGLSGKY